VAARLASLRLSGATPHGRVLAAVAEELRGRLAPAAARLAKALRAIPGQGGDAGGGVLATWKRLAGAGALAAKRAERATPSATLLEVELAVCLWEVWAAFLEAEGRLLAGRRAS
jgi:hypothetical protein